MRYATLVSIAALLATGPAAAPPQAPAVRYDKVYPLQAGEGVFAYARISPDGRTLAYASMMRNQTVQTVVDLPASKVLFTEPGIDAYWSLDGRAHDLPGAVGRRRRGDDSASRVGRARAQRGARAVWATTSAGRSATAAISS